MKRSIFFTACSLMLLSVCVSAQEKTEVPVPPKPEEKKFEAGFDGMIGVSYGSETLGINVGGPSLKYKFTKDFKVGAGAFPSLILVDDRAYPKLAVSPIIEYKKWMLICPYYGYDPKDEQIWTLGIGYKFI